jgi:hypothetical protein
MEAEKLEIRNALITFFKDDAGDVVEYMESMLYDWYQHYAMGHYNIDHINHVVNAAFRVNDLLLKLNDAMRDERNEKELFRYSKVG